MENQQLPDEEFDSTDRPATDLILFALGFIGFLFAAAGVVIPSLPVALVGGFLLLFAVACFALRPLPTR